MLSVLSIMQNPLFIFLKEGKEWRKLPLLFPTLKKKGRGKVLVVLDVYALKLRGILPLCKNRSCLNANFTINAMVYSLCMRFLDWKDLCMWKRENLWKMVHSSKFKFFFPFHGVYLLIERKISPQAYLSFKIWGIEAKVGRLCHFLCKFMCRTLQQHKQALISS